MKLERRYREGRHHAREQEDFVRRHMRPGLLPLAVVGAVCFAIITLAILQMDAIGGSASLVSVVACVFLLVIALMVVLLDRVRDAVFSNEFETALFAGAAGTGAQFLVIIKRNRQVIYVSPDFQKLFGIDWHSAARNLGDLLDRIGMDAEQRDRLLLALISRDRLELFSSVKPVDSARRVMRLSLDPIGRPGGYSVLRGMDMTPQENAARQIPLEDITRSVEHVLEDMPCGVYKVSADGVILYVNPAFEALLGYAPGELLMHHARFTDIVFEGFRDTPFHQRWEGGIALRGKAGDPVRLHLKQVITPNEAGKDPLRLGFVMLPPAGAAPPAPKTKGSKGKGQEA